MALFFCLSLHLNFSMVLLYFYLVGFIRPELFSINTIELYLILNICIKL